MLDIKPPPQVHGKDLTKSFVNTIASDKDRHIYCESLEATKYKANSLLGLVTERYKYIQTTRPELYDLNNDPVEFNNLVNKEKNQARILQDRLKQILEDSVHTDGSGSKAQMDAETIARLESLGYVSGSVDEDFTFGRDKDDPKDLIDFHTLNSDVGDLIRLKKYDEATELCRKLIAQRPETYLPYFHLAVIAKENNDYKQAMVHLQKAIEYRQDDLRLHYYLGTAYLFEKQFQKAVEHFTESLKIHRYQPETHEALARAFYELKDYDKAVLHLNESLTLKPDQVDVLNKLADIYYNRRQLEKTIKYLTESLQLDPAQPIILDQLATSYYGRGDVGRAVENWSRAFKLDPDRINVINSLAWVKATSPDDKLRDPKQALKLISRAAKLTEHKQPEVLDTYAAALAANGKFTEAVEIAEKAIELALSAGNKDLAKVLQGHLQLYKAGRPYREGQK